MRSGWIAVAAIVMVSYLPVLLASDSGTVSGTVAYVNKGKFAGEVRQASVVVGSAGREVVIKANDTGDFGESLPVGKWELIRVLDGGGKRLVPDRTQARWFIVSVQRNSRFDVIVRAPAGKQ